MTQRIKFFCLALFAAMLCFAASVSAQQNQVTSTASTPTASLVPRLIKFNGTLLDEQGRPMKSPAGVTFALYVQQFEGAALWMETQNVEVDAKGDYLVLLGANSAHGVPAELFATGEARWLGVQVERQPEQPRVLLVSVPYALKAGDAQTLGGLPPSAFLQTQSRASGVLLSPGATAAITPATPQSATTAVTTPGLTSGTVPVADGTTDIKNSQITDNGTTVAIGGCTPDPTSKVDVCGGLSVGGALQLPSTGKAIPGPTGGMNSQPLDLFSSTFSSALGAIPQHFRWQLEPVGQNTATPGAKLSLQYAAAPAALAETGLSIDNKGLITFVKGQTFPLVTGNETVSGNLAAGGSVSGASAKFAGPVTTGAETVNGNITDTGNISASGSLSGTSLILPNTTSATVGVISFGGTPFAHDFGAENTFLGQNAGNFKTSGNRNTAVGVSALQNNTTGAFNAAHGFGSLFSNNSGSFNTAMGENALLFNTGGSNNTATGEAALYRNTVGSNNTALGVGAGSTITSANANTTGSNNTFIGYQSGPGTPTQLTNATAVGANSLVSESNALVLGGTGASAVNVGIGTPAPAFTLDVHGPGNFTGLVTANSFNGQLVSAVGAISAGGNLSAGGNFRVEGGISASSSGTLAIDAPFVPGGRFTVLPNGNVGINNPAPSFALDVNGTVSIEGANAGVNGTLNVGAPGVPGSFFTVRPNGNVGINNPDPSAALDVVGSVRINGDIPVGSNPHMVFSAFQLGSLCGGNLKCGGGTAVRGGAFVPDRDILITRMTLSIGSPIDSSCGSAHADISNGLGGPTLLTVALPANVIYTDSGHEAIGVPAGTFLIFTAVVDNSNNCSAGASAGGDVFANVQYVMQ